MIAVGDFGAVLRWVGLIPSTTSPAVRRLVSTDALLNQFIDFLKVRFDGRAGPVASGLAEIQIAVHEWYPTWPVAARVAELATTTGVGLDAVFLTPIALAAERDMALVTTSPEMASIARDHVTTVLLLS